MEAFAPPNSFHRRELPPPAFGACYALVLRIVSLGHMECGCAAWHPQTRSTASQTQLPAEHFWRERALPARCVRRDRAAERPRAHSVRPRCVVTGGSTRSGSRVAELYPSQARPRGAKAPGWRAGPRWRVPSAFFSVGWVRVQECFLRVEDPTRAQGSEFWPQGTAAWARDAGPQCESSTRCTFLWLCHSCAAKLRMRYMRLTDLRILKPLPTCPGLQRWRRRRGARRCAAPTRPGWQAPSSKHSRRTTRKTSRRTAAWRALRRRSTR